MSAPIEQMIEKLPLVGSVGMKVSRTVHNAVLQAGGPVRQGADVLHGVWLRHPLHPLLTDITVAGVVMGAFFDTIAEVSGSNRAAWAGDRMAEVGTAAAIPTALAGLTDFSTVPKPATKPATLHAMLNIVGVGLSLVSVVERRKGHSGTGRMLSMTALGITVVSGWLGGTLVYRHKVGVDHRDQFSGPKQWQAVLDAADLPEQTPKRVEVGDAGVLLYREDGQIYAIGSVCSHAGGPLENGQFKDGCVTCPWHDSVFRLSDGGIVHGPTTQPQQSFQTREYDGQIEIRL